MKFQEFLKHKNVTNKTPAQVEFYKKWMFSTPNSPLHAEHVLIEEAKLENERKKAVASANKAAQVKAAEEAKKAAEEVKKEEAAKSQTTDTAEIASEEVEETSEGFFAMIGNFFMSIVEYFKGWFKEEPLEEESDEKENVVADEVSEDDTEENSEGLSTAAKVGLAIGVPTTVALAGVGGYYLMSSKGEEDAPKEETSKEEAPKEETQVANQKDVTENHAPLIEELEERQNQDNSGLNISTTP